MMEKCLKCGREVQEDDIYEVNGQKVCEDCKLNETKVESKPCGNFNG